VEDHLAVEVHQEDAVVEVVEGMCTVSLEFIFSTIYIVFWISF